MTPTESEYLKRHKERHEYLHMILDELVADFIDQTGNLPSKTTIIELMQWSNLQTKNPTKKPL